MPESPKNLGKIISMHGTSPVFLQRASIVAILSFLFFLAMLITFYTRQQFGYFVLSTAFLVVNIFTLIGWLMQKRNVVKVYENGLNYRKAAVNWDEIASVNADNHSGLTITKVSGEQLTIPRSIDGIGKLAAHIREHIPH